MSPDGSPWPPGIYFRMHLMGFFEGIEPERGRKWRFADSLSLRQFLGCSPTQRVPDHSTLSRTRQRLPWAVHQAVFALILGIVETQGPAQRPRPGGGLHLPAGRCVDEGDRAIPKRALLSWSPAWLLRRACRPPRPRRPGGWTGRGKARRRPTASGCRGGGARRGCGGPRVAGTEPRLGRGHPAAHPRRRPGGPGAAGGPGTQGG
jgi:hypothetical protein